MCRLLRTALAGFVVAALVAASTPAPEAQAATDAGSSGRLSLRESLVERVRRSGPRGSPVFTFQERRRTSVRLVLTGDLPPDATLDASTPVAVRIGPLVLESTLGSDPRWVPGRRAADLQPLAGDPDTRLRVRWRGTRLRLTLRTRSDLLVGDPGAETPDGPIGRVFDAAAQFGDATWFLHASAAGRIRRGEIRLPDGPVPLRRARLGGAGVLAPPEDDPVAPTVAVTAPASGLLSTEPSVRVTGSALDDRTVAHVTWSLDGGPAHEIVATSDPDLSPVLGQRVEFDFGVDVPEPGLHTLVVSAVDPGGSAGSDDVTFSFVVPIDLPLATGGHGFPASFAVVGGELLSWGDDDQGRLGDGDAGPATQPAPTAVGLSGVRAVSMGYQHALALLDDGTVMAWGSNLSGELGDGTSTRHTAPSPVTGIADVVDVSAGYGYSLALRSDGTVWGWGWAAYGELGTGVTAQYSRTPVQIQGLSDVVDVAAGSFQSVALLADGTVRCWGYASLGGTPSEKGAPVQPALASGGPLDDVVEVAAGWYAFLARRSDGTLVVWGSVGAQAGGIGIGPGILGAASPTPILDVSGVVSIATGVETFYAVLDDGALLAWGANASGQLGDDTTTARSVPGPVPGITSAIRVHAGPVSPQALAQLRDNRVLGWGYYSYGATRPTMPPPTREPVEVPFPTPPGE